MRWLVGIICFATVFGQQSKVWHEAIPSFYGPLTFGWQLALFTEKPSFFTGEPALVMLVAENTTSKRLRVGLQKSEWLKATFVIKRLGDPSALKLRPPVNEFERLRRVSGHPLCFPHFAAAGPPRRPGGGKVWGREAIGVRCLV